MFNRQGSALFCGIRIGSRRAAGEEWRKVPKEHEGGRGRVSLSPVSGEGEGEFSHTFNILAGRRGPLVAVGQPR